METINSIFAPVGAAARHLSHALHRIQGDVLAQAKKSGKVVRNDIGLARADLNEALSRLGDATDQLRDTIDGAKSAYTESMLDNYNAGTDYVRALKARADELHLPEIHMPKLPALGRSVARRRFTAGNVALVGAVAGVGYAIYRFVQRAAATPAPRTRAAKTRSANNVSARKTKPRTRKTARGQNAAANASEQATTPTRPH
jgi:hypothetical protein